LSAVIYNLCYKMSHVYELERKWLKCVHIHRNTFCHAENS